MTRQIPQPTLLALAIAASFSPAWADTSVTAAAIEIVGATPLPGIGLPREQVPANVQVLDGEALAERPGSSLTDIMNRSLDSVFINEVQGNPLQADVSYRGFTASPLLGTPQGMSVYLDGVRLNQPFGDVVSWDLIPRSAIAGLQLMPGSNPLFGLNTLGGALSLQTKDGYSHPGTAIQALAGTYGRQSVEFEHGGHHDSGLHWFVTGNGFREAGWREASPSRLGQLFGKLGWLDATRELALTVATANTRLTGNGLQEDRLLERDWRSVYTRPDETANRSLFVNLSGKQGIGDDVLLAGNAYYRRIRTSTFNGDINEDSLDQATYLTGSGNGSPTGNGAARARDWLATHGYAGRFPAGAESAANTAFPFWRCIAEVGLINGGDTRGEPAEKCNGLINRTETSQTNYGLSGQLTFLGRLAGHKNQFTAGAAYDASRVQFRQGAQFGYLNADRGITPVDFYADGTARDDQGNPVDARVDLRGRTHTWSVYATDTITFGQVWHLTLSGRYNRTTVVNRDQLQPGGGSGSLDGDHRFGRLNPAIGLVWAPTRELSIYGGYNEGSRTPTTIELGCADPANPCKLPNAMAGDPPLRQVVTKTWEAGLRGRLGEWTRWNAGLFRADNHDDILFVANSAAGYGYFRNFGQTRRQGMELGIDSRIGPVSFGFDYTLLDATFQSAETVNGAANSSADADGHLAIQPGNRLPLTPRHLVKAFADWQINRAWSLGLGMHLVSGSLARGNENGRHQPDGVNFIGSGKSAGYALFDLGGKYRATRQLSFFAQINNLFDRKYATAAQLGATGFNAGGNFVSQPFGSVNGEFPVVHSTFYAPGAPRTAWLGVRYEFGGQ